MTIQVLITFSLCLHAMGGLPPREIPSIMIETKERLRELSERQARGEPPPPMTPETQARFEVFRGKFNHVLTLHEEQVNQETVRQLEDYLYSDMGEPYMNNRMQLIVIDEITLCAQKPDTPLELVDSLRAIVLRFAEAGGGCGSPLEMTNLAESLAILGGVPQPDCDRRALELCERADAFARELDYAPYINETERHVRDIRKVVAWHPSIEGTHAPTKPTARSLSRLGAFESCIRILSLGSDVKPVHVERACNILAGLKGPIQTDAVTRLLLAMRELLDEKVKRKVPKEVIRCVDAKLIWLAGESTLLTTPDHWSLWADDVAAMGPHRASGDLKRFLHDKSEQPPSKVAGEAVSRAIQRLKRD